MMKRTTPFHDEHHTITHDSTRITGLAFARGKSGHGAVGHARHEQRTARIPKGQGSRAWAWPSLIPSLEKA